MDNDDLLKEIQALRAGQEKLLALVGAREGAALTSPVFEAPEADLGRIYRTQGMKAFKEALREQNEQRKAAYRKKGDCYLKHMYSLPGR